ncbi:Thermostable carboxypeptidase 2 [Candidatus Accumulibacter aalborgensis]|uniref:Thermostable carboxypeptidase 2 n=2 Tax=Candidatus Accumulibacter aalborgensis TaxID=1860102 RepID=A0A1A8XHR6_9PROT|nr:Thermostable carboxypeptidase 2 [Candidatus Accumulibacter aalborgensis]
MNAKSLIATVLIAAASPSNALAADDPANRPQVAQLANSLESKVIGWRRDIHQNPELGNREFRTSRLVAEHLRNLGIDVRTGVAHTGVVGVLKGRLPGPVVALRADMDGLPVSEQTRLPFASKAKAMWMGQEVGVAHVCGHDGHTAILMGVAEILATMKDELPGTVKFIFQPAEEGAPPGEEGGASLMVKEGALRDPVPAAIFGLHLNSRTPLGHAGYRPGPFMASGDTLKIVVRGAQTHGALPWLGTDPIVIASQVVLGLQTIQSRQVNVLLEPSVITIGAINGGNRSNIIPDSVELLGTIRSLDEGMRRDIHRRIITTAESIAKSAGGSAELTIVRDYDVTNNDERLAEFGARSLRATLGEANVFVNPKVTVSEDFSAYQKLVPGFFFFLGVVPDGTPPEQVFPNHSAKFWIDERVLTIGVRALANLTLDFLAQPSPSEAKISVSQAGR